MITAMWIIRQAKDTQGRSRPETLRTFNDVTDIPRKGDILEFKGYEVGQQTVTHVVWEESPVGDGFHEVTVYTRDTEIRDYEY